MSTVEGVQYRGGKVFCYLSTPRYWTPPRYSWYPPRYSNFKGWYPPTVLNTSHGTHDIPPRASWYPHGTEHPLRYSRYPPRYSWTPPTVMNTPHGTQDIPQIYHDTPHGTEHPHGTQDIPHGTHDIPPRYCTHIIQAVKGLGQAAIFN